MFIRQFMFVRLSLSYLLVYPIFHRDNFRSFRSLILSLGRCTKVRVGLGARSSSLVSRGFDILETENDFVRFLYKSRQSLLIRNGEIPLQND